jgi:hypothetical protein
VALAARPLDNPPMTPFLLFQDADGRDAVLELDAERIAIGRRASCDLPLPWDAVVSRVHAELLVLGDDWVVCDDGLSHNGTFVNGERVRGRRRLQDGDVLQVGATRLVFCLPGRGSTMTVAAGHFAAPRVTAAQLRLLIALCRPLLTSQSGAAPASNRAIADELVLSVDTVKGTLSALYELFGVQGLPQNAKRAALAFRALPLVRENVEPLK